MHYGYTLVWKDKDGYELPFENGDTATIFKHKDKAEEILALEKSFIERNLKVGRPITTFYPRWWWFDKRVTEHVRYNEEEQIRFKRIFDTLFVKRVTVA
ncbi:Hypothetical protein KNT65_gp017 [Escherichia phage EcS1]|uniref:Uncharacterized protein n=1 Tax=Escherichia phage EcS1 TaxID=2083276 RepID=A0A2Z5ZC83_9CAUD|nr:Hypothetical protein KNT65_gp017 [Escherichia phage EcS1]BBC78065.1 Hypothetical protein [Escherichia phage EcS1]